MYFCKKKGIKILWGKARVVCILRNCPHWTIIKSRDLKKLKKRYENKKNVRTTQERF